MSSSAVVVIIVGAVIWSIACLVVRGLGPTETGAKPATAWRPTAFAGSDAPAEPGPPARWTPAALAPDHAPEPLPPLPPRRRARAVVLLATWVAGIGAAAAAAIGLVTLVVAEFVDRALG